MRGRLASWRAVAPPAVAHQSPGMLATGVATLLSAEIYPIE